MAKRFNGDARRMRSHAADHLRLTTGIRNEKTADFAVALLLIEDLKSWPEGDRQLLKRILEAKTNGSEARYLQLLQRHSRLREEIIRLGSS
jgi:hypothetical protein